MSLIPKLNSTCPMPDRINASTGKLILVRMALDSVTIFRGALRASVMLPRIHRAVCAVPPV